MESLKAAHERERTLFRVQVESLRGTMLEERLALQTERAELARNRDLLATQRSAFEAEQDMAQKDMLDDRKSIVQNLHRIIETIQPKKATRTIHSAPGSTIPLRRAAEPQTGNQSTPRKRQKNEADTGTRNEDTPPRITFPFARSHSAVSAPGQEIFSTGQGSVSSPNWSTSSPTWRTSSPTWDAASSAWGAATPTWGSAATPTWRGVASPTWSPSSPH
ncbi:hypothetical protein DFH09DRAFT_1155747 [Mycena vulgaris]|nr:hypothetical protein DFH09DRAFT_1155747 [Mycena vulgaris]